MVAGFAGMPAYTTEPALHRLRERLQQIIIFSVNIKKYAENLILIVCERNSFSADLPEMACSVYSTHL